ncbi:hypothetical protein M1328_01695 [Patescibacteria group bacterium]|nr:hypothetical protein [Patescibacteria group bacterium]
MVEMGKTFYVPGEIEHIRNKELRDLVVEAIGEKNENLTLLIEGEKITFPVSKVTVNQLKQQRKKLIDWAIDPVNPKHGIEGIGFELLMRLMLKEFYKDNKDIIVVNTPAAMDFISQENIEKWGPTSDILIGKKVNGGMEPLLLIGTTLRSKKPPRMHNKLAIPVFTLTASEIFGHSQYIEQFYINMFGMHPHPKEYAFSLVNRKPIRDRLKPMVPNFKS